MRSFFAELAGAGYVAPREVLSGHGASRDIGQTMRAYGVSSGAVVVVADAVVSRAGLLDAAVAGLRAGGFDPVVFDEIDGEPNDIVTMRAAEQGRACGAVAVVGVGGGSALDVAKVVALLLTNSGTIADWLGVIEPVAQVAPLVLIPTTTGTGRCDMILRRKVMPSMRGISTSSVMTSGTSLAMRAAATNGSEAMPSTSISGSTP